MVNRILYWFVTLPAITKAGCTGVLGVSFACSCLFVASIPGSYARGIEMQTATAIAADTEATQVAVAVAEGATSTSIAAKTATSIARQAATATRVAAIQRVTATALAAPTATAQAYLDATSTAIAGVTATAQAEADATAQAVAMATEQAASTATAQARAEELAATEQAIAQATATIEDYRRAMPKGWWQGTANGVGVVVGDFRYTKSTGFYSAGKGAAFVAFGISVFNHSGSEIHVNPLNVTLVDLEGRTYSPELMASADYWSEPLGAVDVLDGNKASGGMVFTIDADSAPAQIVYETNVLFGDKIIIDLRRPPDQTP